MTHNNITIEDLEYAGDTMKLYMKINRITGEYEGCLTDLDGNCKVVITDERLAVALSGLWNMSIDMLLENERKNREAIDSMRNHSPDSAATNHVHV